MKNKYYTPKIEEFYIGFEYERYNGSGFYQCKNIDEKENSNWLECKFYRDYKTLEDLLELKNVRVKYLDEDDILSLGFRKYKDNFYFHDKYNLMMNHSTEDGIVGLATSDPSKNTLFATKGEDPNKIPRIKIKNKSELKKLLEQLDYQNKEQLN